MDLSNQIVQYLITGITLGSIYAIVALGFVTINNVTGIINLAQGEFVMLGAMISFWLWKVGGLPNILAFILAIIITTLVGILLDKLALKPARKPTVLSLIIITIGASIFLRGLSGNIFGKDAVSMPPFTGDTPITFLGASILPQALWVLGITLVVMALISIFFTFTIPGKALSACSVNQQGARIVGINVKQMSTLTFAISAALGAIGGIIITPITLASYSMGIMLGVKGFAAAALGGLTSGIGAVIGLGLSLAIWLNLTAIFLKRSELKASTLTKRTA